jgi:hypothetical protein
MRPLLLRRRLEFFPAIVEAWSWSNQHTPMFTHELVLGVFVYQRRTGTHSYGLFPWPLVSCSKLPSPDPPHIYMPKHESK